MEENLSNSETPALTPTPKKNHFHLSASGAPFKFPHFKHDEHRHPINVNTLDKEHLTPGQRFADIVAGAVGSWRFIIIQSVILLVWIVFNSIGWLYQWDPRPFILLNLVLSFQAAYTAPFVMMSQNRQAAKDRLTAENDYQTDMKGEQEIRHIMEHLDHQDALILEIVQRLEAQNKRMEEQHQVLLSLIQQKER